LIGQKAILLMSANLVQWDRAERHRKSGLSAVGHSRETQEVWT